MWSQNQENLRIATNNEQDIKYRFDYGQFSQDYFVNKILNIDNGFFLDIGAGVGDLDIEKVAITAMSNTYGLESLRHWKGIGIDYDKKYIDFASKIRSCTLLCEDLTQVNINDLLRDNDAPKNIDYLSFDVDNAQERVLNELDFSTYSFNVITYEHNLFRGCKKHHEDSRKKFKSLGYKMLFGNVELMPQEPVEDWYVNSDLFDKYKHISADNISRNKIIIMLEKR
tara:strand:+ start:187 stop:864 length:678 start_codon:yes stop_codon:yes gene_type:complete